MATQQRQETRADRLAALPKARLVSRRDITSDLMVIKLEPEQGPYKFKPGQYCTLGLAGIERAYSIVSAPHEPHLEIFVELVPEGELTPRMWKLKVGDALSIRPRAKGIFLMDPTVHHHMMLSTVTGVAPSVSMVRDYLHRGAPGHHHFYVIEGASFHDELVYDRELAILADQHPNCLKYIASVSRPADPRNAGWKGVTGRVNAIVEHFLDKFELPQDDTLVYACGHPGMISDAKERVTAKGFKFTEERFWKA